MLGTATGYFTAASFGEKLEEVANHHEAKAVKQTGQQNLEGTPTHEASENSHIVVSNIQQTPSNNESMVVSGIQGNKAAETTHAGITGTQQQQREVTERVNGHTENNISAAESTNESTKRSLEFPLFLTAGIAYTIVSLWIVMEKRITKIPYFITIIGSLLLIGFYVLSHTVSSPLIGLEQVGPLDLTVAFMQAGIIACSGYILIPFPQVITRSTERRSTIQGRDQGR
jgi:hypothetical protein